jgi:hypothetical protein
MPNPSSQNDPSRSNFRYMGTMPLEEFLRRVHRQGGPKAPPRQKRAPKPKMKAQSNHKWKQSAAPKEQPETVHISKLRWQPIYTRQQVSYIPDYKKNTFTVTVPFYHTQIYQLEYIMRAWSLWMHKRGHSLEAIKRSPAGRGQDFGDIWVWLIETGQFPWPIEETLGIRPGFIDMKQTLS